MLINRFVCLLVLNSLFTDSCAKAIQFSNEALAALANQRTETKADGNTAPYALTRSVAQYRQQLRVVSSADCQQIQEQALRSPQVTMQTVDKTITMLACLFAVVKVYQRYQLMHAPLAAQEASYIRQTLSYVCPQIIQGLAVKGSFCIDVLAIACETALYKALAHCVVACCTRDLTDLAQESLIRIKHGARTIVFT